MIEWTKQDYIIILLYIFMSIGIGYMIRILQEKQKVKK